LGWHVPQGKDHPIDNLAHEGSEGLVSDSVLPSSGQVTTTTTSLEWNAQWPMESPTTRFVDIIARGLWQKVFTGKEEKEIEKESEKGFDNSSSPPEWYLVNRASEGLLDVVNTSHCGLIEWLFMKRKKRKKRRKKKKVRSGPKRNIAGLCSWFPASRTIDSFMQKKKKNSSPS
jgi:hypothetical protein